MKRLCLFAGYSPEGKIDDYVVYYVKELSKFADVYYQAANHASLRELKKLDTVTCGRWAQAHEKYDFGSWQKLIFRLGWQALDAYDVLILANDSNYGPAGDLGGILQYMEATGLDAWGITENYGNARHMQSYFLALHRPVLQNPRFRDFFESIETEKTKQDICIKYEIGLSKLISECGFRFDTFINRSSLNVPWGADISAFQNTLLHAGSPFVKRKIFLPGDFANENIDETCERLQQLGYPLEWIARPSAAEIEAYKKSAATACEISTSEARVVSADAATPAPPSTPEAQSLQKMTTKQPIRGMMKRILRPLYLPFKARIVDKLTMLHEQLLRVTDGVDRIGHTIDGLATEKLTRLHEQILHVTSGVDNLRNAVDNFASLHTQILQVAETMEKISSVQEELNTRLNASSATTSSLLDTTVDLRAQIASTGAQIASLVDTSRDIATRVSGLEGGLSALGGRSTSQLEDLQTCLAELHGHVDWVQRDLLIAFTSNLTLQKLEGFKCITDYPVAYDSPDHLHPVGTVLDHTRHPRFIRACEDYFGNAQALSFLDLGCSAGGIVLDAVLRGHVGVGLEGSDISRLQQRAEWRLLRNSLFTCDITRPFELNKDGNGPFQFDVISAWEVLEHLTPDGVEGLFANLARHTRSGSIFACSISQVDGGFMEDGTPLHQTLEPLPWWQERAVKHGFDALQSDAFAHLDFARGNGNSSVYYRPAHSYQEREGDCFLVVFRRR